MGWPKGKKRGTQMGKKKRKVRGVKVDPNVVARLTFVVEYSAIERGANFTSLMQTARGFGTIYKADLNVEARKGEVK